MILSSKKMTSWKKLAELITEPYNIPLPVSSETIESCRWNPHTYKSNRVRRKMIYLYRENKGSCSKYLRYVTVLKSLLLQFPNLLISSWEISRLFFFVPDLRRIRRITGWEISRLFFLYVIYVDFRDERSLACFFLYLIYVEWKGKKSIDLETVVANLADLSMWLL